MFLPFLIGAIVGCGLTVLTVFLKFVVKDTDAWQEDEQEMAAARSCVKKVVAENAELRVAFAAAERTEDAKKVATMTLAALDAAIANAKEAA